MKIWVDDAVCMGHGRCYALAPDVFVGDDEGHAVVLLTHVGPERPELAQQARAAAASCPERAITIEV